MDRLFDDAPSLEHVYNFLELITTAAFAKAALDTLRRSVAEHLIKGMLNLEKISEDVLGSDSGMARVRLADLNGPKWTPSPQPKNFENGPKWTILVHFGLTNAKIQFGIR